MILKTAHSFSVRYKRRKFYPRLIKRYRPADKSNASGFNEKMRGTKIIDCRKRTRSQRQTKTADIVKITPGKTHNLAANKAPFTNGVRLAD